jgi:uncharacterized OsmC-like protein
MPAESTSPLRFESVQDGRRLTFDLRTERTGRQRKRAYFGRFTIDSDEGAAIGGDDSAPPPLAYFAAAIAFWLLTQLARVSEARHLQLDQVAMTVTPSFEQKGSILAGTVHSVLREVRTTLEIDSPAEPDAIATLVTSAEQMCYVLNAIQEPHTVRRALILNGVALPD